MAETLFKFPAPASSIAESPRFTDAGTGVCLLEFALDVDGNWRRIELIFDGVAAYRCSYLPVRGEIVGLAYAKVVRLDGSSWLEEAKAAAQGLQEEWPAKALSHFAVAFDFGPCFEFLATGFRSR